MFVSGGPSNLTISTPVNGTYVSGTLTVNFTFLGQVNFSAYNVTIYNSTSTTLIEHNSTWPNNSYVQVTFDTTSLGDMSGYTINVSVNDSSGLHLGNISHYLNILIDNTNPNSTIVLTGTIDSVAGQTLTSVGKIDYATEATINCGVNDNLSGLNTTRSSVQVKYPGLSSFSNITATQLTISNGTLKGNLVSSDTDEIGLFEMKCILVDKAGNAFSRHFNLTTVSAVVNKGSPFVDPNFVSPIGKTLIGKGTVEDYSGKYGPLPGDGDARLIKKLGGIKLLIADEEHTVMVDDIDDDSITLTISSEPFTIELMVGESKEVDVNGDGVNDLEIFLHKIHQKAADLVFKEISVPAVVEEEVMGIPIVPTEEVIPEVEKRDLGWLWTLLILVVVALLLMWAIHKFSRRSQGGGGSSVKFTPRDLGAKREEVTSWSSPDLSSKKGSKPFY